MKTSTKPPGDDMGTNIALTILKALGKIILTVLGLATLGFIFFKP